MNQPLIYASGLGKTFRIHKKQPGLAGSLKDLVRREYLEKPAVKSFDLEIPKGQIVGLLGPNGAGKTTLMKMFTGIIVPSHGELKIMSHRPWERAKDFRKRIALVMGQKAQLWWDIPAMDSFLLLQRYYEVPDNEFRQKIEEMSTLLEVKDLLHVHIRRLSLGERMKMELMASLLHSPEVIFLDEPTIGLDLVAQENIRKFLKKHHQTYGTTMIVTSHYMADVQELCSRLVLIFDGDKAFDGAIERFEKVLGNEKMVSFSFSVPQDPKDELWQGVDPVWNEDYTAVDIRVAEEKLRELSLAVIGSTPVIGFQTEKLPVERVMKTLMQNPELLRRKNGA